MNDEFFFVEFFFGNNWGYASENTNLTDGKG